MERYDAINKYHAWYEHWHRYHWIADHITGLTVADLACGEGYGSALLGQYADQVWAIDIDHETIQLAQKKYQHIKNVIYNKADVLHTPLKNQSMDAVVSFETLEHLSAHCELLTEFKRILKQKGFLVISTPDKDIYSATDDHNEHHVKELTALEFQKLMREHFKHVLIFGQQFQTNSLISPLKSPKDQTDSQSLWVSQGQENDLSVNQSPPTYLIAVASDESAAIEPFRETGNSNFNDVNNGLFHHYETQVKRLLAADKRLAVLEQQVQQQSQVITQLRVRLGL